MTWRQAIGQTRAALTAGLVDLMGVDHKTVVVDETQLCDWKSENINSVKTPKHKPVPGFVGVFSRVIKIRANRREQVMTMPI